MSTPQGATPEPGQPASANGNKSSWKFIEVDRKTDILALTSFLLSLCAIGSQFFGYVRGARVELFPPTVVVLNSYKDDADGTRFLLVEATMTYANRGETEYNDVEMQETLRFTAPDGRAVTFSGLNNFDASWPDDKDPNKLKLKDEKDAHPEVIPGRSAISHGTEFSAFNPQCAKQPCTENYITLDQALYDYLKKPGVLELTFESKLLLDKKPHLARCRIDLAQVNVTLLQQRGWESVNCYPES